MKNVWRSVVYLTLTCSVLLALPSAQAGGLPAFHGGGKNRIVKASWPDPDPGCFVYFDDIRYCNVVKTRNDNTVCVHKRWGQHHYGQTGPDCTNCFDTVNNDNDFLVESFTTPIEEGCEPYNDCQFGTVYTCAN